MNHYKTGELPDKHYYSTRRVISRLAGKGGIVLDVGCNDGYLSKFGDKSNEYYGIDISWQALEEAKKYYTEVLLSDLNKLDPLPWNLKFDAIVFSDVLEHLVSPESVLKFYAENYLKEKGKIVISLPNVANFIVRLNLLVGNFNYQDSGILDRTHLHFYTKKSATSLIESAGLEIEERIYSSNHFGLITKFLPALGGLLGYGLVFVVSRKSHE